MLYAFLLDRLGVASVLYAFLLDRLGVASVLYAFLFDILRAASVLYVFRLDRLGVASVLYAFGQKRMRKALFRVLHLPLGGNGSPMFHEPGDSPLAQAQGIVAKSPQCRFFAARGLVAKSPTRRDAP